MWQRRRMLCGLHAPGPDRNWAIKIDLKSKIYFLWRLLIFVAHISQIQQQKTPYDIFATHVFALAIFFFLGYICLSIVFIQKNTMFQQCPPSGRKEMVISWNNQYVNAALRLWKVNATHACGTTIKAHIDNNPPKSKIFNATMVLSTSVDDRESFG